MIVAFSALGVFLAVAAGGSVSRRAQVEPRPEADLCPYRTPEEWQLFLEHFADNPKWVVTCEDSPCDARYYRLIREKVEATFEACAGLLAAEPRLERCTRNMRQFTPTWLRQHDGVSYGFDVDNHTYLMREESPDKPAGMMNPPEAVVAALPDRERVEEAARRNGWRYLTHDSALGGYRTFVFIPDPQGRFDQWMLLNLKTGDNQVKQNTPMSILVVQKKDAFGRELSRVRLYFRDYNIMPLPTGYRLALDESKNGKCFACHSNGVRQLIARHTPILESKPVRGESGYDETGLAPVPPEFAYERLQEFNRRLRSYGSPDWDGTIHPERLGPALGKAQGCVDCHDGNSRGALSVLTSTAQLERKVYYELAMPPDTALPHWLERNELQNPGLSHVEAVALEKALDTHADLIRDFERSRFPALRNWFLEVPCLQ